MKYMMSDWKPVCDCFGRQQVTVVSRSLHGSCQLVCTHSRKPLSVCENVRSVIQIGNWHCLPSQLCLLKCAGFRGNTTFILCTLHCTFSSFTNALHLVSKCLYMSQLTMGDRGNLLMTKVVTRRFLVQWPAVTDFTQRQPATVREYTFLPSENRLPDGPSYI